MSLSTLTTWYWPEPARRRQTALPMKPAPPVTSTPGRVMAQNPVGPLDSNGAVESLADNRISLAGIGQSMPMSGSS